MTMHAVETPPIDPAVEKSRAIIAGLADLATAITNHPELAGRGVSVEMSVYPDDEDWAATLAAVGSYEVTEDDLARYYRRIVHFGEFVTLKLVGPEKPVCEHCHR